MAGYYADVPAHRMCYDKDGTVLIHLDAVNAATTPNAISLNDDTESNWFPPGFLQSGKMVAIFPEKRDLLGVYLRSNNDYANSTTQPTWATSVDSTNGIDGTWVALTGTSTADDNAGQVNPNYRTMITAVSALGIVAVRYIYAVNNANNRAWQIAWHMYGNISSGENPNRLSLWHPTSDVAIGAAYFDWGNVGRSSTADRTFRVKNLSATLSANTITCSTDVLADTSPTVAGQHTLSNGGAFAATASAGTLAAGAISGVMTLRRTIVSNAVSGLWTFRVNASAASWS
jgi:hypothetical protein